VVRGVLELLKEAVPELSRALVLSDLGDSIAAPQLKELEHAAHSLVSAVELATRYRLPGMYPYWNAVTAGGLMAYISRTPRLQARSAFYVDRILKGAKPGAAH
jgi:hypothetical protein